MSVCASIGVCVLTMYTCRGQISVCTCHVRLAGPQTSRDSPVFTSQLQMAGLVLQRNGSVIKSTRSCRGLGSPKWWLKNILITPVPRYLTPSTGIDIYKVHRHISRQKSPTNYIHKICCCYCNLLLLLLF